MNVTSNQIVLYVIRFREDDETDHRSQRSFPPCVLSIYTRDPKMPSK